MSLAGPEPLSTNPLRRLAYDLAAERRATAPWPPGDTSLSLRRTHRITSDPLHLLLDAYERHGPIFTLRILSSRNVFMLGPEANHFILLSHFDRFRWRDGGFGDLIPLLGDGLLTIDGEFWRRSRRIMLPAFHRERIAAALGTMTEETERAVRDWRPGDVVELYHWARVLALRIAMRALFGLDPDARRAELDPAREFERALGFYGYDYFRQMMRGPGSPWSRMHVARLRLDRLIYAEIARRRDTGERGEDILSLLLDAEDEDGTKLSDRHVRDEVMTLLFAGHDTTTATVAFLFYELARSPEALTRLQEEDGPAADRPALNAALDETLRLYPPAWIGPRRARKDFEFAGHHIPAGMPVNYSSWASHHLPDVWEDPEHFDLDRWTPERRAALPKGAYVPFGGGSRTCIGMRFGQLEIKVIASRILRDLTLRPVPGYRLRIRQTPTLGPRDGLPMIVTAR